MNTSNSRLQVLAPILVAIGLAVGVFLGAALVKFRGRNEFSAAGINKFREIITQIDHAYVDPVNPDEMINGAIENMLEHLDPHSVYIPREDVELTSADLKGEFEGIGIEFNIIRDTIVVIAPIIGGPSESVGLRSGDKIVKVNGETVAGTGITFREVIDRLRGPKGSEVMVSVARRGFQELFDFTITRDKIPQYSVDVAYMVNEEIGYIKISRFSATTYTEFIGKLNDLKNRGMKKLIIDLQGNPGGYMDRAVEIADEFIRDDQMIVSQQGKVKRYKAEYKAVKKGVFEEGQVVVLIDEGSASGSEIVAGALQDNDRGLIVGRRSFGKGLVQMPINLSDGSELRLTIARYYTPSGRCIQKPYNGNFRDYHQENNLRFMKGEMFSADSIHFEDSLKYYTRKGRPVYGGGGIMPDLFVPLDTSMNTPYYLQLIRQNIIREFSLEYVNKHREKLQKMSLEQFIRDFTVTDEMFNDLVLAGEKSNILLNSGEFKISRPLIVNRLKSFIARSLWDNEGLYRVANEYNEIYNAGLRSFNESELLAVFEDQEK